VGIMTKTGDELLEEYRAERYIGKEPETVTVTKYLNTQTIALDSKVTAISGGVATKFETVTNDINTNYETLLNVSSNLELRIQSLEDWRGTF